MDHLERPVMLKGRHLPAYIVQVLQVDIGEYDCRLLGALAEDFAPRRYNETVPERFAAVLVLAALRGGEYEGLRFSIARARRRVCQCAMPVGRVKAAGTARNLAPARASAR